MRKEKGGVFLPTFTEAARFEHGFWLQVLGDHARFIHDALAPSEEELIERANYFIQIFDQLLGRVPVDNLAELSAKAKEEAEKIRELKLKIIEKHLVGKVKIQAPGVRPPPV
jgi:hypothetical protein